MCQIAEQVGARWTVVSGALMIAVGLALSSVGERINERRVERDGEDA